MTASGEWKTYDYIPFQKLRKVWQIVVLKLIRRSLTEEEKRRVQPLLQKAYLENKEGFYVHAPKQRRAAIAVDRIISYDGKMVVFRYHDKTDDTDKEEQVTVEEFISRLIRHIPDEQFKMIRHYGVYEKEVVCKRESSNVAQAARQLCLFGL